MICVSDFLIELEIACFRVLAKGNERTKIRDRMIKIHRKFQKKSRKNINTPNQSVN